MTWRRDRRRSVVRDPATGRVQGSEPLSEAEQEDRAVAEAVLQRAVLVLARRYGWRAHHVTNSRTGRVTGDDGFPDLVLVRGRALLFAELKQEDADPSPEQAAWLYVLREAGAEVYVWRPSDLRTGAVDAVLGHA